jgi:hypothetical protein
MVTCVGQELEISNPHRVFCSDRRLREGHGERRKWGPWK